MSHEFDEAEYRRKLIEKGTDPGVAADIASKTAASHGHRRALEVADRLRDRATGAARVDTLLDGTAPADTAAASTTVQPKPKKRQTSTRLQPSQDASYDELKAGVEAADPADVDGVVAWVTAQLSATDFDLGLPTKTVGAAYAQGFLEGAADILAKV